ncbi:uncharacterized protein [Diabrotica undecimpunctata]|uniref:uncharacterized protein isoform X3 n=1 Tax=Diabrotica undecimpunctata TaxID=50387 RepID=UPI003B634CA5
MKFKVEIREDFVFVVKERNIVESSLSTSTDIGGMKNEPEDISTMEVKAEVIKKEFAEDDQKGEIKEDFVEYNEIYVRSPLSTSTGIGGLKNESEDTSAMEVEAEIKKELAEDDQGYIENHLNISLHLGDFKNERDEDNSGFSKKNGMAIMNTSPEPSCNKKQLISPQYGEKTLKNAICFKNCSYKDNSTNILSRKGLNQHEICCKQFSQKDCLECVTFKCEICFKQFVFLRRNCWK